MPKVSVIIPTYNCVKYLPEALDSVFAQTFQDFEVVLLDDGSSDYTRDVVDGYSRKYPGKIKYIFQENKGLAIARNVAIQNSSGEYIAILDADDAWLSERLKAEVEVLDAHPDVGLVHANIAWMSEEGKKLFAPKRRPQISSGWVFRDLFLRNLNFSISTVLVRKECFERAGLFDENLTRLGCEDREMWLRIAKKYEVRYIDKVLGCYRIRKGSMSRNREKMRQARYYVVDKHCPVSGGDILLRRRALARIHKDSGDDYLREEDFSGARKEYLETLACWPFYVWAWINLVKALFGIRPRGDNYV